jgi:hypothetical protein
VKSPSPIASGDYSAILPRSVGGSSGLTKGAVGTGEIDQISISHSQNAFNGINLSAFQFGTSNQPFTTSRVNPYRTDFTTKYPFRAAGKLIGREPYICSASLIKKSLLVTAAHCVTKYGAGKRGLYGQWVYVPAKDDSHKNKCVFRQVERKRG